MTLTDSAALALISPTSQTALELEPKMALAHYTVIIPYAAGCPTPWHPTSPVGAFKTLSRGAFKTEAQAHEWAAEKLEGHPYSVDFHEAPMWTCLDELCAA